MVYRLLVLSLLVRCVAAVFPLAVRAQASPIPIRRVAVVATTDSGALRSIAGLHARSDGRVLVGDTAAHALILFDASLKSPKSVGDAGSQGGAGGLFPFAHNATAVVDIASKALVVFDSIGAPSRTYSLPNLADLRRFTSVGNGVPAFDASGRLYYRASAWPVGPAKIVTRDTTTLAPDSAPIVRADLESRRIDTVAAVRIAARRTGVHVTSGRMVMTLIVNPLSVIDGWAAFSDGTVAVVRGADYHVDWYSPNGDTKSTPKMPIEWRRLTDDDRRRIVDSVQHVADSTWAIARAAATNSVIAAAQLKVVPPSELPEYVPALRPLSPIRVDAQGRLWVLPATSSLASGGIVYDVVTRDGVIAERVQLPAGRVLQGFGPDNSIYMSVHAKDGAVRVERGVVNR